MIKFLFSVFIYCVLSLNIFGLEVDTIVPFSGSSTPSGTFYFPMTQKYDLVLGFSSVVPASVEKECDMFFLFDNYSGQQVVNQDESDFYLHSFQVVKNWMYPLTKSIDLGVSLTLIQVLLDDVNDVLIFPSLKPIIGLKIVF
jgi:hypothetical protein